MSTTVAIIQARMGSTRLPGKVLMDLAGMPVLAWSVRAARAIPGIDRVTVATSIAADDDPIAAWCAKAGVSCRRGSLDDVLDRFATAARAENADTVMRLTADCPLLDPQVCGTVLRLFRARNADYASNIDPPSWPDGLDCEVFRRELLEEAAREARVTFEREHVTPFMRAQRARLTVVNALCPVPGMTLQRWTLDQPDDLDFLRRLAAELSAAEAPPSWLDVLDCLDTHPELRRQSPPSATTQAKPKPIAAVGSRTFARSRAMLERACRTIPLGSQTFSKSFIQYPEDAPLFLAGGHRAHVWDLDGNRYVDMVSGLLPVLLGYRDPDVDDAIRRQLNEGICLSLATVLETELAERLVAMVPCAEMVRFGKNGTDATSAAIRLARAFTGRDRVAVCGYHGWQDWYIGATSRNKGVPTAVRALTHIFPYNDLAALDALLGAHPGEFAAVMMEPMAAVEPKEGYLAGVRDLAHRHGALMIFDEIITGFRFAAGGAQELFGVTPDLASFGKAMGNGMPIAAVVGRAEILREMEEVFFSGTFGGEALSLAAAIATVDKIRREPVIETLWEAGKLLSDGAAERIGAHGLGEVLGLAGLPPWRILSFHDHPGGSKEAIKTVFIREMLQAGVLINASHNVGYAHGAAERAEVFAAYDHALGVLADELARGDLDARLGNQVIRPVFSVRSA